MIEDFIKSLILGFNYELKEISPEYLLKKKSTLNTNEYIKWLRKQVTICQSQITIKKESGKKVPDDLLNKYKLIENERAKIEEIIK